MVSFDDGRARPPPNEQPRMDQKRPRRPPNDACLSDRAAGTAAPLRGRSRLHYARRPSEIFPHPPRMVARAMQGLPGGPCPVGLFSSTSALKMTAAQTSVCTRSGIFASSTAPGDRFCWQRLVRAMARRCCHGMKTVQSLKLIEAV